MSYEECFAELTPLVDKLGGSLWMRQMTLGPAKEFCLHAEAKVTLPNQFRALEIRLRKIWNGIG